MGLQWAGLNARKAMLATVTKMLQPTTRVASGKVTLALGSKWEGAEGALAMFHGHCESPESDCRQNLKPARGSSSVL